ncbi:MAG: DUF2800 domain-containing protein [Mesorhizobium sp.]|uniref:DUF2800 domain-containing protein n=1 Tax=Mesorhizobium sp. TaxID=1871066 RepID=UPI000FE53B75|nr:DUF2800 domain-containing protein [Mesorhizobium sp.]RWA81466.1 MAG: DUF2800 domain-containing protein [Mesorhizobium sp.]
MADHGARDHATWSASATARNVHCAGALTLAQFAPPQRESIHSARGTACHQIAEKCLRTGVDASSFLGEIEKTKEREIEIDEELVNSAQEYVDYCRSLNPDIMKSGVHEQRWIEQKFDLSALGTPFDAGGTGDFVCYDPRHKTLEIVDLKNGMGVVDVNENPQLRTYGLGALLAHPDLDVERVTVTIVQPRAPHKDGRIRSETFHVADLIDWTADLLKAMQRSKQAMDEHAAANGNTVLLDEWRDKWLKPGKCTFCPVEGSCPALKRDAMSVAAVWFDDMDQPRLGNAALDTDPASLNRDLNMIPMLEDWIKARRALAHSMAEQGVEFEDHMLVDKIGNRKWADDTAPLVMAMQENGVDPFAEPKLLSPAQLEKLLGSKRKALIEPFVVREVTGTNLVSRTKTTRSAAKTKAETYFEAQP